MVQGKVSGVASIMPGRKLGERRVALATHWKDGLNHDIPGLEKEEKIQAMRIKIDFRKN